MPLSVRVIFNRLPGAALKLRQRSGQITQQSAQRIVVDAQARVAVDTGETRDHIEAIKEGAFTWAVISTRPSGDPNVPNYLEHGTSKMPARPYLAPAAEAERGKFLDAMDKVLDELV